MFDSNNNYVGAYYNRDRMGHTTPDCDASDPLQPFLPVSYPAPWLPAKRRDDAHPAMANVVVSSHNIVGQDKSGALIPAGFRSGNTGAGGDYVLVKYGTDDVGFTRNAATGDLVASATEYALIAAPAEAGTTPTITGTVAANALDTIALAGADKAVPVVGTYLAVNGVAGVRRVIARTGDDVVVDVPFAGAVNAGTTVTIGTPTIAGITPTADDITFAQACDLIPGGSARGIGYALRNMWQYIGGFDLISATGGMRYNLKPMDPTKNIMHNYQHEPGNAVRTSFVIRVPWIGSSPSYLQSLATADSVTYTQTDYSRSFTHITGAKTNRPGGLFPGALVVPSTFQGDAGNYMAFDPAKHEISNVVGRVLGFEHAYDPNDKKVRDFLDRVRSQHERGLDFKATAFSERNPVTGLMSGSATRGIPYQISLGTNGLFRSYVDAGKVDKLYGASAADYEPLYTTVLIRILL